jgi:hypothetical protein
MKIDPYVSLGERIRRRLWQIEAKTEEKAALEE